MDRISRSIVVLIVAFGPFLAPSAEARFLQADPAGYKADLDLYSYAQNDPTDKVDPLGLYDCSGSGSDCKAINNFVAAINKSLAGLDPKSAAYQKISAVVSYLGKAGDDNGVTIQATSLRGVVSEARANNTIAIDVKKAQNITANGLTRANPDSSTRDVRNAQGGSRVGHEAQNEIGMNHSGPPYTRGAETSLERSAFGTEADILRGLGIRSSLLAPGAIDVNANRAASAWCAEAGDQGPSPSGC